MSGYFCRILWHVSGTKVECWLVVGCWHIDISQSVKTVILPDRVSKRGEILMQNIMQDLVTLLAKEPSFIVEGKLSKGILVESALNMDTTLLDLLVSDSKVSRFFFKKSNNYLVFDKVKFQQFILNKDFLPDSYTQFQINIGLATEDHYLRDDDRVFLNWPYKDCVLEGGQSSEEAKREEIFWNEYLAPDEITRLLKPKVLSKVSKHGSKKHSKTVNLAENNNLVIRGNNLLALHTLKPRYGSRVDVIYIDPPYYFEDTKGSDTFSYNSNFKLSSWLTFMRNRLEVSKQLLHRNGVLFISTNDEGVYHLKLLCDEIFGSDKYITNFIWKKRAGGGNDSEGVAMDHEYILCYGNVGALTKLEFNEEQLKKYKYQDSKHKTHGPYSLKNLHDSSLQDSKGLHHDIECPDGSILEGKDYQWKCNKETFEERKADDRIVFSQDKNGKWRVEYKIYLYENKGQLIYDDAGKVIQKGIIPNALLDSVASNSDGTKDLKILFPEEKKAFSYPKPVKLIKHLLKIVENKNAVVFDFFAGSGTTGHATLELNKEDGGNRIFVLVEQMDYVETLTKERIKRAIKHYEFDSSFIYCELHELNQSYVSKIKKARKKEELLEIWHELKTKAFLNYKASRVKDLELQQIQSQSFEDIQKFLLDLIDNNHLYLPLSEIEDDSYDVDEETVVFNKQFFGDDLNV
jgi:adenine-specific DNA-methyltransferase